MRTISRRLNDIESFMLAGSREAPWEVSGNSALPLHVRGVDQEALERGLAAAAAALPILRADVVDGPSGAELRTVADLVPPVVSLGVVTPDHLPRLVETVLDAPFVRGFFRVHWARLEGTDEAYVVFSNRHPFGDHVSMLELALEVMRATGGLPVVGADELPPSMEDLLSAESLTDAWPRAEELIAGGLFESRAAAPSPAMLLDGPHTPATTIFHARLDATRSSALLARARSEGVSLTSLLGAAYVLATAGGDAERRVVVEVPVNLRPFLGRPLERLGGLYVSLSRFAVIPAGRPLVEVAREVSGHLKRTGSSLREAVAPMAVLSERSRASFELGQGPFGLAAADFTLQNGGIAPFPPTLGSVEVLRSPVGAHAEDDERTVTMQSFQGSLEFGTCSRAGSFARQPLRDWFAHGLEALTDATLARPTRVAPRGLRRVTCRRLGRLTWDSTSR